PIRDPADPDGASLRARAHVRPAGREQGGCEQEGAHPSDRSNSAVKPGLRPASYALGSRYHFDTWYRDWRCVNVNDLLLVPLEDTVVFPGMTVTLAVDTADESRVLLVPRHEQEYAKVGTVAQVDERVRLPRGGSTAVVLTGIHRAVIGAAHTDSQGRLRVEVEEQPDQN